MKCIRYYLVLCSQLILFIAPGGVFAVNQPKPLDVRYYYGGTVPEYAVNLLKLALAKSGQSYQLTAVNTPLTIERVVKMVEDNDALGPNVFWAGHNLDKEQRVMPICFPIDRGLIAYRMMLIKKETKARITQVGSLAELKKFRFVQGFGWSDIDVLRRHGMKVEQGRHDNLYKMLMKDRGDLFPRSIMDIQREYEQQKGALPDLRIENKVALLYERFMVFYFVNKQNITLHDSIYTGLKRAFADGSFMQLFLSDPQIADALQRLQENRKVIRFSAPSSHACQNKIAPEYIDNTILELGW